LVSGYGITGNGDQIGHGVPPLIDFLGVVSNMAPLGRGKSFIAASTILRVRLIAAPITLVTLVGGSAWAGAQGYTVGFIVSAAFSTALLWFGYRQVRSALPQGSAPRAAT
jgi:hypothetical protein